MKTKENTYRLPIAYSIATPESADHGDYAERGWEDETGCGYDSLEELAQAICQYGPVDGWDRWYSTVDAEQDWQTGESTTRDLFPERNGVALENWPLLLSERLDDLIHGR